MCLKLPRKSKFHQGLSKFEFIYPTFYFEVTLDFIGKIMLQVPRGSAGYTTAMQGSKLRIRIDTMLGTSQQTGGTPLGCRSHHFPDPGPHTASWPGLLGLPMGDSVSVSPS